VVKGLVVSDFGGTRPNPPIAIEHSPNEIGIKFEVLSDGTHFSFGFRTGATVDDARCRVAKYLCLDSREGIALMVEGRGLINRSLLRNAGIGDRHVTVCVIEAEE
jgi:hypothetical protein